MTVKAKEKAKAKAKAKAAPKKPAGKSTAASKTAPQAEQTKVASGVTLGVSGTSAIRPVRKLSPKTLMPNIKAVGRSLDENSGLIFIGRMLGLARSMEPVETDFGIAMKFKGEFRGFDSGEVQYIASVAYFPAVVAEPLEQALLGRTDQNAAIDFAFDLFIQYDVTSAPGYVFVAEVHSEPAASEPLAGLMAQLPHLPKATS
jgi:hypothetical protein